MLACYVREFLFVEISFFCCCLPAHSTPIGMACKTPPKVTPMSPWQ